MSMVKPPRAFFINFPLGRPCGKPGDVSLQRSILKDVLETSPDFSKPGEIKDLPYEWDIPFTWEDYGRDIQEMLEEEGGDLQNLQPEK